jgi:hypothetical protein
MWDFVRIGREFVIALLSIAVANVNSKKLVKILLSIKASNAKEIRYLNIVLGLG